ncbi:MAG: hydroxyphenylacetyl-CoA thioesterase PaaI [Pseudomonadota bacterium]
MSKALAQAAAQQLFEQDKASQSLNMILLDADLGVAQTRMTVSESMINGAEVCHGGFIFTLADSAFAFACNSHNVYTVAAACSIEFLAPGKLHDVLTATASERCLLGRQGIYDVDVHNQRGELIAVFRGKSARLKETIIKDDRTT